MGICIDSIEYICELHLRLKVLCAWLMTLVTDGIDGKQARRTGTSGPLGELFDHGLDSWATLFMPIGIYSVFGRGPYSIAPDRCFLIFLGVMIMFVVSHWEKYNTGVLFLPWGYDISQLVSNKQQYAYMVSLLWRGLICIVCHFCGLVVISDGLYDTYMQVIACAAYVCQGY